MKNKRRFLALATLVAAIALAAPTMAQQQIRAQTIGSQRTVLLDFTDTNVTDQEIDFINQTYTTTTPPDGFWYGFKRFGEGFQMFFTFDPNEKIKLRLRFAQERLSEAKYEADKGDHERARELVREYENEVNETDKDIDHSRGIGENVSTIAKETENELLKSTLVLHLVYDKVPDSAKPAIQNAINNTLKSRVDTDALEHNWTKEQLEEKFNEELQKHEQRWISMEEKFENKLQQKLSEIDERIQEAIEKNQTEKTENLEKVKEQINESIAKKLQQIEDKRGEFKEKFQKMIERLNRTEENETEEEEEHGITGNVLVGLDKANYTENETITITVKNNLSEKLYYGGCGSFKHKQITLQDEINGTWSEVNGTQDWFVCLLATEQPPTALEEGQTVSLSTDMNQTLIAGTYRAAFDYKTDLEGRWLEAYSDEFSVV